MQFSGKTALITGAGSGIGRAAAAAIARHGIQVALLGRQSDPLTEVASRITADGGRAIPVTCDVTVEEEVAQAVATVTDEFGGLDYVFNNAGTEDHKAKLADLPTQEWDRVLSTNLTSVYYCMKYELLWLTQRGGVIVNTSSTAGVRGFAQQASYVAAKHGVIGLSKAAALDYAPNNVRVNVIAPGLTQTGIFDRMTAGNPHGADGFLDSIPLARPGTAEEVASTFVWLCSDDAAYTTGATFVIDGGLTI